MIHDAFPLCPRQHRSTPSPRQCGRGWGPAIPFQPVPFYGPPRCHTASLRQRPPPAAAAAAHPRSEPPPRPAGRVPFFLLSPNPPPPLPLPPHHAPAGPQPALSLAAGRRLPILPPARARARVRGHPAHSHACVARRGTPPPHVTPPVVSSRPLSPRLPAGRRPLLSFCSAVQAGAPPPGGPPMPRPPAPTALCAPSRDCSQANERPPPPLLRLPPLLPSRPGFSMFAPPEPTRLDTFPYPLCFCRHTRRRAAPRRRGAARVPSAAASSEPSPPPPSLNVRAFLTLCRPQKLPSVN